MSDKGIGASVRRKEDARFVRGRGAYVADMVRRAMAFGAFVRSPHAHATITVIDTTAAGSMPGVVLVLTGADLAAAGVGLDKTEIRRRNMIPKEAFPYQTPVMMRYDSGDPLGCMERALAAGDYAGFPAHKAEAAARGKLRGIGLSTYIEACGLAPSRIAGSLGARGGLYESATVRVHPTGQVTVLIGTHSHGQGHETTFAQIVAEKLGVKFEDIDIVFGDTDRVQFGMGTYGSRSLVVGGAALAKASDRVIAKGRKIAAHLLEAAAEDVEFDTGTFRVKGCGEVGTTGAPAAVMNAVVDALAGHGIQHMDMPASPGRVWAAINATR
jgi:carbon-monoxide dehydrogenase large subunit